MAWVKMEQTPSNLEKIEIYYDKLTGKLIVKKADTYSKLKELM